MAATLHDLQQKFEKWWHRDGSNTSCSKSKNLKMAHHLLMHTQAIFITCTLGKRLKTSYLCCKLDIGLPRALRRKTSNPILVKSARQKTVLSLSRQWICTNWLWTRSSTGNLGMQTSTQKTSHPGSSTTPPTRACRAMTMALSKAPYTYLCHHIAHTVSPVTTHTVSPAANTPVTKHCPPIFDQKVKVECTQFFSLKHSEKRETTHRGL